MDIHRHGMQHGEHFYRRLSYTYKLLHGIYSHCTDNNDILDVNGLLLSMIGEILYRNINI